MEIKLSFSNQISDFELPVLSESFGGDRDGAECDVLLNDLWYLTTCIVINYFTCTRLTPIIC